MYKLGEIPISLHGDEVGVGYNAYSLLTAGVDEYGKKWPLTLRSDVPPGIYYFTIPFTYIFGLTNYAIRFPSVIIGVLSIVALYFLVIELLNSLANGELSYRASTIMDKLLRNRQKLALLTVLLMAISPWHIQISRIAHDAAYGLLLQMLALILYLKFVQLKKISYLYISMIFWGLSLYNYHSPKITTPLLMVGLMYFFRPNYKVHLTRIVMACLLFGIIIFPIVLDTLQKPLAQTRFGGVNIFIRQGESSYLPSLPLKLAGNFINQYNPWYLFIDTSSLRYFSVRNSGLFLITCLPWLTYGLIKLRNEYLLGRLLIFWLLIAPLPGALTLGLPNAGRIILLLPVITLITALGFLLFWLNYKNKLSLLTVILFIGINLGFFLYQYFNDSPLRFLTQWQYGGKEIAEYVAARDTTYNHIVITDTFKQAYIYILFYGKKSPQWLATAPSKKLHPFIGYSAFANYEFRKIDWDTDLPMQNTLLVTDEARYEAKSIGTIKSPSGENLYYLIPTNP
jgi:4-amino-4-deoxy-L-arabinose transferase-like glycosyltransferase